MIHAPVAQRQKSTGSLSPEVSCSIQDGGSTFKPRGMGERLALIVLAVLSLGSCPRAWAAEAPSDLVRASLRLVGRWSTAHACPIGPREALTNAHVLDPRPFERDVPLSFYAWSDGTGASGFLVPVSTERARDLGTVQPLRESDVFPHYLPLASEAPKPGDRIWFLGYSWANKKSGMADDVIEAKVSRVVALHVMFYPSGKPGSSGSCIVNDAGEVVAINEGGYETDDKDEVGLGVGVWGGLHKTPED